MLTPDMMIIYFIMTLLIGYGIGFFTVKINHGLVILFGRMDEYHDERSRDAKK